MPIACADVNDCAFKMKTLSKPGGRLFGALTIGGVAADEGASLAASPSSYGRDEEDDDCASGVSVANMGALKSLGASVLP